MQASARSLPSRLAPGIILRAARELGPAQLALYLLYQAELRTGWLRRRTPICNWQDEPLGHWLRPGIPADPDAYLAYRSAHATGPQFFFDPTADLASSLMTVLAGHEQALLDEADDIAQGKFRLFGGPLTHLGFPPDWGAFAPLGDDGPSVRTDLDRHWTEYAPESFPGDIKLLWETSRFGWVFLLGRAFRVTGNERYAEIAWALIESWRSANRPNAGPHWFSAQEVALRLMALAFGLYSLWPALVGRPERVAQLAEMVAVHATRIPTTLAYSRSLNNNHLVTEAVGLYTAGLLFPEFRQATRWRKLGRRWLTSSLERQIFPDGGHVQHSINYHRLVLQAALWAVRLAELNGEPLTTSTTHAVQRGAQFLATMAHAGNGRCSNFGPNDGALILPLTTCDFSDYRPTLQLAAAVSGNPALPRGPWDEACIWLGLDPSPVHGIEERSHEALAALTSSFPQAGLHHLRAEQSQASLRCARFTSRPGHSDQLHLDLWWHGNYLVRDPGSYLYNGAPPWNNGLAGAGAHNTLGVDDQEPMLRAGPFLWLEWAQGRLLGRWQTPDGRLEAIAATHDGYRCLGVTHRRMVVRAGEDLWLVIDDLLGHGSHPSRICWQLADCPSPTLQESRLILDLPQALLVVEVEARARDGGALPLHQGVYRAGSLLAGEGTHFPLPTWGWWSPTYAVKEPALTLSCEPEGPLPLRLITWLLLAGEQAKALAVKWNPPTSERAPIQQVEFEGTRLDILDRKE